MKFQMILKNFVNINLYRILKYLKILKKIIELKNVKI